MSNRSHKIHTPLFAALVMLLYFLSLGPALRLVGANPNEPQFDLPFVMRIVYAPVYYFDTPEFYSRYLNWCMT